MTYPVVYIKWIDPHSIDEWEPAISEHQMLEIETVGFLIKSTKDLLVVSLNYDPTNENISCTTIIPRRVVTHYKRLDYEL